jgi:Rrf2 family protein
MKITAPEEYGLRCLLRVARAGRKRQPWHDPPLPPEAMPVTGPEIAAAEKLSLPYVGKLMRMLRQAGLVKAVPGSSGGFRLARPPEEIRLGAVLLALGEPLFEEGSFCERHTVPETGACVNHDGCTLRALWRTLEGWMRRSLNQLTLADLLRGHGHVAELLRDRLRADASEPAPDLIPLTLAKQ